MSAIKQKALHVVKNSRTFIFLIAIASLLLGIGYAQISDIDLTITGSANMVGQTGIIITDVTYDSNNNANVASSIINSYYETIIDSSIKLGNTLDSTITYEVTIKNLLEENQVYNDIVYDSSFYDNDDIEIITNGLNVGDVLIPNEEKTFTIIFKYKDTLSTITNNELNSFIKFKFDSTSSNHKITYDSSINTTGYNYPTQVSDGGKIDFKFQGSLPTKVFVNGNVCSGYNMNTGRLVVENITEDITISADYTPIGKAVFSRNLGNYMKNLAGGADNIQAIKYASEVPDGVTTENVRLNTDSEDIFMWFDSGTIYWNSVNPNPTLSGGYNQLFKQYSNLRDIEGLLTWDTSEMDGMHEMFQGCKSLTSVEPLKYWDVSKIPSLLGVFNGCNSLTTITGLDNWDVSNVKTFNSLFVSSNISDISALTTWKTDSLTAMSGMFQNCNNLSDITALKDWDISKVTEMIQLFQNTKISNLEPISNWDVRKVKDMRHMFYQCRQITTLEPLTEWQTDSLTSLNYTFSQISSLTNLKGLNNWNVSAVTNFANTFDGCSGLTTLEDIANWNVSEGTTFNAMFYGNTKITSEGAAAINNWRLKSTANFGAMFKLVSNKPTFMFDVNGVEKEGTWDSNGTLIPPTS